MWHHILFVVVVTLAVSVRGNFTTIQEQCNKDTDRCLSIPKDCKGSTDVSCTALAVFSYNKDTERYNFKVATTWESGYVALGFSDDTMMGDDAVVECLVLDTNKPTLKPAYNNGTRPTDVPETKSLIVNATGIEDGLFCEFEIQQEFDAEYFKANLTSGEYYLLLVYGPVVNNSIRHHNGTAVSDEKFVFNSGVAIVSMIVPMLGCLILTKLF